MHAGSVDAAVSTEGQYRVYVAVGTEGQHRWLEARLFLFDEKAILYFLRCYGR